VGALIATSVKAAAILRGAFVTQIVFMALNNLTFFVFWWALMDRVPHLHGWRLEDVQVLFGVVAVAFGLAVSVAGGVRHLGRLIDSGELDALLTQPQPVLLYALGLRSQASGLGDALSGIVLIVLSGQVSWLEVPVAIAAIVASAVVIVASGIVFFSLAFWLGRMETMGRQLWELLITFSLYPEPLFGSTLRLALFTVVPAGLVGYVPARIVRDPSVADVAMLLSVAGLYIVVAVTMFERGLRRYASGSRFGVFG
jgi:ABC-2 type transport system permease protein